MQITDAVSISELSRLLKKSRPTVYKYITDYESGNIDSVPKAVRELFRQIVEQDLEKDAIDSYCEKRFGSNDTEISPFAQQAIDYIVANQDRIDFYKLDHYLRKVTH